MERLILTAKWFMTAFKIIDWKDHRRHASVEKMENGLALLRNVVRSVVLCRNGPMELYLAFPVRIDSAQSRCCVIRIAVNLLPAVPSVSVRMSSTSANADSGWMAKIPVLAMNPANGPVKSLSAHVRKSFSLITQLG